MTKHRTAVDWNDFPLLLAVARERQLRAASRSLGIDSSTVSRRLAAAEKRLGARLFTRDIDGYSLTTTGETVVEAAQEIERKVLALYQKARQTANEVSGPVRITSVDVVLMDWLTPRLLLLLEAYPGLQIKLIPENRSLSFSRGETDLALRLARPREDAAIRMRRIGCIGASVYGHPKFRHIGPDNWKQQPWLLYNDDIMDASPMKWLRDLEVDIHPRLRSSSTRILVKACEAGLGIALLPCIATQFTDLVRLSPTTFENQIWLLSHRETADIPRFRVVADWLAQQMSADKAALMGSELLL